MEILSSTRPKARVEHRCDYCWGKILKGETYEKTVIKDDELYTWKSHLSCEKLVEVLKIREGKGYGEGITEDDFSESIYYTYIGLTGKEKYEFKEAIEFLKQHYNIK